MKLMIFRVPRTANSNSFPKIGHHIGHNCSKSCRTSPSDVYFSSIKISVGAKISRSERCGLIRAPAAVQKAGGGCVVDLMLGEEGMEVMEDRE